MLSIDINIAIERLGLQRNRYSLSQSIPPHMIIEWDKDNPDPQPTTEELQAAWEAYNAQLNVPESVDMRRARLALLQAGLLNTVEGAIASMSGTEGKAARIEWEYAATIKRNHPLVLQLQSALSLTGGQLDRLFIEASNLE